MIKKYINKYYGMSEKVRAAFWFFVCSFLQKGISSITTPIFTRLMNPAEYGQYSVFNSWLGIVTVIVSLRLYYGGYTRGLVKYEEDKAVFSSSMQGLNLLLTLGWTVVYLLFQTQWNQLLGLTTVQMLAMLVMIWASSAFNYWAAEQRVDFKYRTLVIVTLLISIAKPLVGIIFVVYAQDRTTARILGLALVEFIGYTGLFFSQAKKGKRLFSAQYWKYTLLFSVPLIPHYLSQTVLSSADRIMIENMVGAREAGIYSLAYSISQLSLLFNTALTQTITPWVYKKIKEGKEKEITRVGYLSLLIIATVNLAWIAIAPEAVRVFAPIEYYEAIWIVPPVAMSVFFIFAYSLFVQFEYYYGKTMFVMIASIIGAVVNVVLNWICIRKFGYMAAGYTTLVCYVVFAIGHYLLMRKICKTEGYTFVVYSPKVLLGLSSAFALYGFVFLITYTNTLMRYGLIFACLVLITIKRKAIIEAVKKIFQLKRGKE